MSELVQLLGLVCVVAGLTWALGPWALAGVGLLFLVVPELLSGARARAREDVEEVRRS